MLFMMILTYGVRARACAHYTRARGPRVRATLVCEVIRAQGC